MVEWPSDGRRALAPPGLSRRRPHRLSCLGGASLDMKIILAAPRGFCAGVNMAIESLDLAIAAFGTPVYVFHEIVHNKYVVETSRTKGAVFVEDLTEVPAGATLLFSAHGVSPEIRRLARQRQLRAID